MLPQIRSFQGEVVGTAGAQRSARPTFRFMGRADPDPLLPIDKLVIIEPSFGFVALDRLSLQSIVVTVWAGA